MHGAVTGNLTARAGVMVIAVLLYQQGSVRPVVAVTSGHHGSVSLGPGSNARPCLLLVLRGGLLHGSAHTITNDER